MLVKHFSWSLATYLLTYLFLYLTIFIDELRQEVKSYAQPNETKGNKIVKSKSFVEEQNGNDELQSWCDKLDHSHNAVGDPLSGK